MLQLYKESIILDKSKIPNTPAIQELLEKFSEKNALNIIKYIFLTYDRSDENPLKDFPESERATRARHIVFGNANIILKKKFPKDVKLINEAIKEYEKETIDKIQKDIDLYDKKMYQFIALLNSSTPEIIKNIHSLSGRVTFSTNIDILTTILDNSINIILDKAALTLMKKTGKFSNELRGSLSPNTKGKLKK